MLVSLCFPAEFGPKFIWSSSFNVDVWNPVLRFQVLDVLELQVKKVGKWLDEVKLAELDTNSAVVLL